MTWYEVLLAARKSASKDGLLTSESLALGTGLPVKTASAWLSKFVRWGYCLREGSETGKARWVRTFKLTKYGLERGKPKRRK